jgi:hypothetical protein
MRRPWPKGPSYQKQFKKPADARLLYGLGGSCAGAAARLQGLWIRIPLKMDVYVLYSLSGVSDELITRSDESNRAVVPNFMLSSNFESDNYSLFV